ncbi:MAG: flavin reductase family protein [Lachnospiraceae bacterium]|nr:flavin reductase family protein [Lachnospiraceae bacterium]
MGKRIFGPGTMLNPVPVVMVSCGDMKKPNIITVAWTGTVNSEPPMTYISVRKSRYSHDIIGNSGEFVINLTTEELAKATDFCGVRSGRDLDKFKETGLTAVASQKVDCPSILESPVNIECRVVEVHEYPSHDMFVAEILSVSADESLFDDKDKMRLDLANLIVYNHGSYQGVKRSEIGSFGYSVMKKKTRRRRAAQKRAEQTGRRSQKHR